MKHALAWLALACALPAHAVERIRVRAASLTAFGQQLVGVDASLRITSANRSTFDVRADRVVLPKNIEAQTGALTALQLVCANPVIVEPEFECPALTLRAGSTRWADISVTGKAGFNSDTGRYTAAGGGMQIAGAPLRFTVAGSATGMQAQVDLQNVDVAKARDFLAAQKLPMPDLAFTGTADLVARVIQQGEALRAEIDLSLRDAGYQNADFTMIGEKLGLHAQAKVNLATPVSFELKLDGSKGQALAGPVLLDFNKNPLQMTVSGNSADNAVRIVNFRGEQRDLATMNGSAELGLSPFMVKEASVQVEQIRFPAAYTSFLQLTLSTTAFNQLTTTGNAELRLQIRDSEPVQLDATLRNLTLVDAGRSLTVNGVNSELHWTAGLTGPPRPSWLSWQDAKGWGIEGAPSRLDFITQDQAFRLVQPARLPFFDGALRINTLAADGIGTDALSGVFDAIVEPISVAPIAKAFGLPEFAGQLSGRIPGLTYKDKTLTLQGNLEAGVFGGKVVASNLRLRDPLGAWPRLYGDVTARNLELALITGTFDFGSITGKLDVDLKGLETFNWSPVAFDLSMATPKGDRSKHRISQRAVQNLSDIGGGGGGVAAALQSGALKFFDTFGYDRIGLSCQLRNDVCEMSGVGNTGEGFYIVRGRGLPRIDIIGNNRRVDWPRLVAQIGDALRNPEGIELK